MSVFNFLSDALKAWNRSPIVDPGDAGSISVRQAGACHLRSAGVETRTLPRPGAKGTHLLIDMETDGGDITLTVTGGYNEAGDTTFTFSDPGQFAYFVSTYQSATDLYYWRKISDYGEGNLTLSGLTATVAELNQAADESANVETVAATNVLVASESGKTCFLAHATEFDTKLPAPAAGLRFKFIVGLAPSGASYTITTNGTTQNVIHGVVTSAEDAAGAGAQTNGTPVDVVTFVDGKAQVGDWVEMICDGTLWYLQGACVQQDAITLA